MAYCLYSLSLTCGYGNAHKALVSALSWLVYLTNVHDFSGEGFV
jgi:hypothetical protein